MENGDFVIKYELTAADCGITTTSDDTHIHYNGALYGLEGSANDVISRERKIDMAFNCEFSRDLTISVENFFKPLVRKRLLHFYWLPLALNHEE